MFTCPDVQLGKKSFGNDCQGCQNLIQSRFSKDTNSLKIWRQSVEYFLSYLTRNISETSRTTWLTDSLPSINGEHAPAYTWIPNYLQPNLYGPNILRKKSDNSLNNLAWYSVHKYHSAYSMQANSPP